MPYLDEDFLLHSNTARRLYHEVAAHQPIVDYHTHLSAQEIASNHRWENLADLWLGADHYKWRLMRANGVEETFITGDAPPREKFQAWAETMPRALRNPLYDWTHLELRRYFGINDLLGPATADAIWNRANARLSSSDFSVRGILKKFRVEMIGTTDDPADSLDHHAVIAASDLKTRVLPTFRPDKAFAVDQPEVFNPWIERLGNVARCRIDQLDDLLVALERRHQDFHDLGGRLSDHSLERLPSLACDDADASLIFERARGGRPATAEEREKFCFYLLVFLARLDASRGWTKQFHLGPLRNVNPAMFRKIGPDAGFDTMGDAPQGQGLVAYLGTLAAEDAMPGIVLYNINPADNYLFAAMTGAFQDSAMPGRIQFGAGWWFLDQKEGMEMQLNALSNTGLLSRFVGMLTDSRSFLSFPRHEYFRRIFCNLIGGEVDRGELPDDFELLSGLVADVCAGNARRRFVAEETRVASGSTAAPDAAEDPAWN